MREPMYQQMNEILRVLLKTGESAEGDRFLTERQIADRFQVSRPTANKVLPEWFQRDCSNSEKGWEHLCCPPPLDYDIQTLVSFTQKVIDAGKKPATRVLDFRRIQSSEVEAEVAAKLQVWNQELFAITRLRLADRVPVVLERRWVSTDIFSGLTRKDMQGFSTLFAGRDMG